MALSMKQFIKDIIDILPKSSSVLNVISKLDSEQLESTLLRFNTSTILVYLENSNKIAFQNKVEDRAFDFSTIDKDVLYALFKLGLLDFNIVCGCEEFKLSEKGKEYVKQYRNRNTNRK